MRLPPGSLREAWSGHIAIDDYERHMAAVGQAQANASLLGELFGEHAPRVGARVLFAGAGTGQCFDYLAANPLGRYRVTFTDINPAFLARLAERLRDFDFATLVDDIEDSRLAGGFDLAIAILLLEHVDWRRAAASLARLAGRVFVVIQRNPAAPPARVLPGTLAVLEELRPVLVDSAELIGEMASRGYRLARRAERTVPDGKRMVGLDFVSMRLPAARPAARKR